MREFGPWRTHKGQLDPDAKTRMGGKRREKEEGENEDKDERGRTRNGKDDERKKMFFGTSRPEEAIRER